MRNRRILGVLAMVLLASASYAYRPIENAAELDLGHFDLSMDKTGQGDLMLNLDCSLQGLVAVTLGTPSRAQPFFGTAVKGEEHRASVAPMSLLSFERAAFSLEPVTTKLAYDFTGETKLNVTLYFEDGQEFVIPIHSPSLPKANLSVKRVGVLCYDVTAECSQWGTACPGCIRTVRCCGSPMPCIVCPGCEVVCNCRFRPEEEECWPDE